MKFYKLDMFLLFPAIFVQIRKFRPDIHYSLILIIQFSCLSTITFLANALEIWFRSKCFSRILTYEQREIREEDIFSHMNKKKLEKKK